MRRQTILCLALVAAVAALISLREPRLSLARMRAVKVGMTADEVRRTVGVPSGGYTSEGIRGGSYTDLDLKAFQGVTAAGNDLWYYGRYELYVRYDRDRRATHVEYKRMPKSLGEYLRETSGQPLPEQQEFDPPWWQFW